MRGIGSSPPRTQHPTHETTLHSMDPRLLCIFASACPGVANPRFSREFETLGSFSETPQLACSTCHVVLEEPLYESLEEPSDDENDMLDLAFALTDTSRLGCQVKARAPGDTKVVPNCWLKSARLPRQDTRPLPSPACKHNQILSRWRLSQKADPCVRVQP